MKISDLNLASYLIALDYPLTGVSGPPGRKEFVFENVPDEIIYAYYSGQDKTSARKLFGAFRDLKGLAIQQI